MTQILNNSQANSTILPLVTYPHPILRQVTQKIKNPQDPTIQKLIQAMIATMRANNGLGLAAPQVNHSVSLCIIEHQQNLLILINPKVTSASSEKSIEEEGCLSFPHKFLKIERPDKVTVRYLDESGEKQKIKASGLLARALQHEIDHLNGKLFIDY